jgi:hypothetical protein
MINSRYSPYPALMKKHHRLFPWKNRSKLNSLKSFFTRGGILNKKLAEQIALFIHTGRIISADNFFDHYAFFFFMHYWF